MIWFLIVSLIVGIIARFLVSGGPQGLLATLVLGIVGSYLGGFLGNVVAGNDLSDAGFQPAGFIGSVIGAVVALLIYKQVDKS